MHVTKKKLEAFFGRKIQTCYLIYFYIQFLLKP